MDELNNFSIKARNYKCFGEVEQGFNCIRPFNLVLGRNNSGKSALVEILRLATGEFEFDKTYNVRNSSKEPEFIGDAPLSEVELLNVFHRGSYFAHTGADVWQYGQRFLGESFRFLLNENRNNRYLPEALSPKLISLFESPSRQSEFAPKIAASRHNRLRNFTFKHLTAERDIQPESFADHFHLNSDGSGATNVIQRFLYDHDGRTGIVEHTILKDLNHILHPDLYITRILCRRSWDKDKNEVWEVYIREENKGEIALSQSGSGLKTMLLVLLYLHVVPVVESKALTEYIFAFEELENNLHPATLRRLLRFLYDFVCKNGCKLVLTTHSNVEIDFFCGVPEAQVLHVTHDGQRTRVDTVLDYHGTCQILNDLDIRASDLLQANGVIWVEGPSDRIYLNRWIELWSHEELKEGLHYQCVFYGGKLLSHLNGDDPEQDAAEIRVLHVNRNCAILIDSDRRNKTSRIGKSKKRIRDSFKERNRLVWITIGKEIENYLPPQVLSDYASIDVSELSMYSDIVSVVRQTVGKRSLDKVRMSRELVPKLSLENCTNLLDLDQKMNKLCATIRSWNKIV